jgi:hypothetical protein
MHPCPNSDQIPRYVPEAALPPYSYVSGKFPHPKRDAAGHSYGVLAPTVPPCQPRRWADCRTYLRGVDLFNHGYYWEAHEEWELLWNAAGRRGPVADFLKGLIILACAGVKAREGRVAGVRRLAQRAGELFRQTARGPVAQNDTAMGLSLPALLQATQLLETRPEEAINTSNRTVEIVMPFVMQPHPQ